MTTILSAMIKRPLAVASGAAAVALVAISLSGTAHAAMTAKEFMASLDELKQICHRIDETLWMTKRNYGCGERIVCSANRCYVRKRPIIKRKPNNPGIVKLLVEQDGADRDNDNKGDRGKGDRGKGGVRDGNSLQ